MKHTDTAYEFYLGDCMNVMPTLPDNSIDLILTDPPYFKVKGEAWDRQWDKPEAFLEWIGLLCDEWHRLLKPNGSLYVFASPKMAARVETKINETFNVLNQIRWNKPSDNSERRHVAQIVDKRLTRTWYPSGERIIFAEHYGADESAAYKTSKEFVFEPLKQWFIDAWVKSGLKRKDVDRACGTSNVTQYWLMERNYQIPTEDKYAILRSLAPSAFTRGYDDIAKVYESLKAEYEALRRPFDISPTAQYTDLWDFPTVSHYPGKHPCEKPNALLRHIIQASSRPEAVVLDCFMGSGSTGVACAQLGRQFIGIEMDERYYYPAQERVVGEYERASGKPEGLFG